MRGGTRGRVGRGALGFTRPPFICRRACQPWARPSLRPRLQEGACRRRHRHHHHRLRLRRLLLRRRRAGRSRCCRSLKLGEGAVLARLYSGSLGNGNIIVDSAPRISFGLKWGKTQQKVHIPPPIPPIPGMPAGRKKCQHPKEKA